MRIKNVVRPEFSRYGRVVEGIDFTGLIEALNRETPLPDGVVYEPSVKELEALPVFRELQARTYGEMPIQIGYCNGNNRILNALEYHRSSEINVAADDVILLVGARQDIGPDFRYDTSLVEAFMLQKGMAVELYETTLHYAPCNIWGRGFRVAIVLPRGTNLPLEESRGQGSEQGEDRLLAAKNKWLIGHPEGGLPEGTYLGLVGENVRIPA